MNLQPSNRRQDAPVRLGSHGYRLDGDFAVLNAELHVPPYCSGSSFGLELWACSAPHLGGSPEGVKIAEVSLDLPTPIGPHLHRVEARAPISAPRGTGDHSMVLVVVAGDNDTRRIHDYSNFGQLQHFASPALNGAVAYSIQGNEVVLEVEQVQNPRPEGNESGSLSLELWASAEPFSGGTPQGQRLAAVDLGSISGGYLLADVSRRVRFSAPQPGRWHVALVLREWTLPGGYVVRDHRNFDLAYEQAAPSAPAPSPAPASSRAADNVVPLRPLVAEPAAAVSAEPAVAVAPAAPARVEAPVVAKPAAVAEPVVAKPAAVVAEPVVAKPAAIVAEPVVARVEPAAAVAAPAVPAASASGKLSVHTATVDELAKLPGLSLKVAKEIVKSRPFASLDALVDVRGIGEKTLRRIKSLITL